MYEVLVYLFENYYQTDGYPDHDTLAQKLTAAGFEDEDIHDALDWLEHLASRQDDPYPEHFEYGRSIRAYSAEEVGKLSTESRGFLAFLESARVVSPTLRELIIERAMALDDEVVDLDRFKVVVLMVLWARRGDVDTLILDELLPEGEDRRVH